MVLWELLERLQAQNLYQAACEHYNAYVDTSSPTTVSFVNRQTKEWSSSFWAPERLFFYTCPSCGLLYLDTLTGGIYKATLAERLAYYVCLRYEKRYPVHIPELSEEENWENSEPLLGDC